MTGEAAAVLDRAAQFLLGLAESRPEDGRKLADLGILLRQMAGSVDEFAAVSLQHGAVIKAIVSDTCRLMPSGPARSELEASLVADPSAPEDFHARSLAAYVADLEAAMVRAHTWLETTQGDEQQRIIARIWAHLEQRARHESRLIPAVW